MSESSPTPAPGPPIAPIPGSEAAEIAIVASILTVFLVYHIYYFERHRILSSLLARCSSASRKGYSIDLWTTALESRVIWAKEMMKQPHKDDALLAMHTFRNVIIAATLMVTGIGQVLARLFTIITTQSSMQQIEKYTNSDPIGAKSFTSPELKVALSSAVLLISFGAFAQCARLSVHLSFMFRVAPATEGKNIGIPLRSELVAMTHRVSVYFTVGIRLIYLFFILISWCMGVTAMLIFFVVVMALMVWSDYMPSKLTSEEYDRAEKVERGRNSSPHSSSNGEIHAVSRSTSAGGTGYFPGGESTKGSGRRREVHAHMLGADGDGSNNV